MIILFRIKRFSSLALLSSFSIFCVLLVPAFALSAPNRLVTKRVPVFRDLSLSAVGDEKNNNQGGKKKLKLKSQQELVLFDFDLTKLRQKIVKKATLHVRTIDPFNAPLGRVSISSLASEWVEGDILWPARPQTGSSSFSYARHNQQDWSYPGSSVMDVVLGRGNTVWKFSDCTLPDAKGWQECAIDPTVVAARIAGVSQGFCLYDDVGSTWAIKNGKFSETIFPNRLFYSHEKKNSAPWVELTILGADTLPPSQVQSIAVETIELPPGEAILRWEVPHDLGGGKTIGFFVKYQRVNGEALFFPQYLVPMVNEDAPTVQMHIHDISFSPGEKIIVSVVAVDSVGNKSPPFLREVLLADLPQNIIHSPSSVQSFPPSSILPTLHGLEVSIIDLLDKINPVTGKIIPAHDVHYRSGNHLYSANQKRIRLQSARNETSSFQLNLAGMSSEVELSFRIESNDPEEISTKMFLFNYVRVAEQKGTGFSMLPDPLIPLDEKFSIPSRNIHMPFKGQKNISVLCELYVPHTISAGQKSGTLSIKSAGEEIVLQVDLNVWDFTLPDKLSFVPEMNAYSTVSPYKGYAYYRLAHEHRTCINRLPYGWSGQPSFAPEWNGDTFEWTKWDKFVGPLLDGSAFSDLRRKNEPVDVLYLPFSENWPVNLSGHYSPSYWAENAFDSSYSDQLGRAFKAFASHCKSMGWSATQFQFYLNNKVRYRKKDPKSSAPWLLDEPVDTKDFWALRWYGRLFKDAVAPYDSEVKFPFRADISYSQFGRNILWGIADIEYLGGNNFQKTRMKRDEQFLYHGAKFAEYGNVNKLGDANTYPVLWCILAWGRGANGVLPWQTIGSASAWETGEQTALFYPGPDIPYPSIRLKAFTRGQQDVEYLNLFRRVFHLSQWQVVDFVKNELSGLRSSVSRSFDSDAGIASFEDVSPAMLWKLRYTIGKMISLKHPKAQDSHDISVFGKKEIVKNILPNLGTVKYGEINFMLKPDCDKF